MAQILTTVSADLIQPTTPCTVLLLPSSVPSTTRSTSAAHASPDTARRHRCRSPSPLLPDVVNVDATPLSAEDAAAVVLQRQVRATGRARQCRKQTAAAAAAVQDDGVAERLLPETAVTEERATVVRIPAQDRPGMPGTVVAVVDVQADGNEAPKCVADGNSSVVVVDPEEERVPLAIPDEVAPGISKEALLRLLGENGEDDIAEELYTPFPGAVEDGGHDDGSGGGGGSDGADDYSSDEDEVEDDAVLSKFIRIRLDG
jgi:hypothetical protein